MIRRIVFTALMLIMVPAFAFAGSFSIAVTSGSTTGTVAPAPLSGYAATAKSFTATPATNYALSKVTRNGVDVTANTTYVNGTTITIPLSTSTQTFYVSFAKNVQVTPTLSAVLPANVTIPVGTPSALSGGNSAISNLNTGTKATFTFSGTNLTFSPVSGQVTDPTFITTNVTAAASGTYTGTLTLTAPNGAGTVTSSANVTITVQAPGVIASNACLNCHNGWAEATAYATSVHAQQVSSSCQGCHNGANHPSPAQCATCHSAVGTNKAAAFANTCRLCHGSDTVDVHGFQAGAEQTGCTPCHGGGDTHKTLAADGCIGCHSVAAPAHDGNVNDNNGVRSITQEFGKWSHHVTGVTLNNAHCAACHLEGTVNRNGEIAVDDTYHMADAQTHLRNADTDADMAWNPAAPNFTTMDNFCLSCHDANGATSTASAAIQAYINANGKAAAGKTASATNPFGDTISNQYDMLERPAVVDAAGQFATGNNSHHAVLGKRYTGRTRIAGARQIDTSVAFNNNSSASLPGARSTIYDAGKFQSDYTTLADASGETDVAGSLNGRNGGTTLGDDSTLHCGDCHTVGQFRAADVGTRYNKAVIGAHGSSNEYLLRNNIGSDERHQGSESTANSGAPTTGYGTKPYLVCFNCHAFATYGTIGAATNIAGLNHAGEYAHSTRCNGPFNTVFGNMTGEARLTSVSTTAGSTYGKRQSSTFGNMFGIQCANCHNSGVTAGNIFGGIHGSKDQTYTDGMGNTTKHIRFMPGLGNVMYVPGTKGGVTGGSLAAFNVYSGNRNGSAPNGTTGQTYTTLPVRTIVPGTTAANVTVVDGKTVPAQPAYNASATLLKTGSYQYVTGGVSSDLNWEQKSAQPIAGQYDFQAKSMGCYTLAPPNVVKVVGRNGDADKYPATNNLQAGAAGPNGTTTMFDNWGGCDDHNGAQGAGTAPFRKVLRKVTY